MQVMIIDVAYTAGGAETILRQYYNDCLTKHEDSFLFVTSNIELAETNNIRTMRYPKAATSKIYRIMFDLFVAPRLVKNSGVQSILSLQNVDIPFTKVPQTVYLHQAAPFTQAKMAFGVDKRLWFYQNVYKYRIRHMLRRADKVIVQTKWMKDGCLKLAHVDKSKVVIEAPHVDIDVSRSFLATDTNEFIYPANGHHYKNHRVIVEAVSLLKKQGICDFEIKFTISGHENVEVESLFQTVNEQDLPIRFIGIVAKEEMIKYYEKSALLFSSYLESFGLPLLEAKSMRCPIIAADTLFAHEILDGYDRCQFFQYNDARQLAECLTKYLDMREK